jgi:hypothetical protein
MTTTGFYKFSTDVNGVQYFTSGLMDRNIMQELIHVDMSPINLFDDEDYDEPFTYERLSECLHVDFSAETVAKYRELYGNRQYVGDFHFVAVLAAQVYAGADADEDDDAIDADEEDDDAIDADDDAIDADEDDDSEEVYNPNKLLAVPVTFDKKKRQWLPVIDSRKSASASNTIAGRTRGRQAAARLRVDSVVNSQF